MQIIYISCTLLIYYEKETILTQTRHPIVEHFPMCCLQKWYCSMQTCADIVGPSVDTTLCMMSHL